MAKPKKLKKGLVLEIKLRDRIFVHYPAKSLYDARLVRNILSPPDGPVPYSNFRLFRDGEEISFYNGKKQAKDVEVVEIETELGNITILGLDPKEWHL